MEWKRSPQIYFPDEPGKTSGEIRRETDEPEESQPAGPDKPWKRSPQIYFPDEPGRQV
jgi:hypothetical protein